MNIKNNKHALIWLNAVARGKRRFVCLLAMIQAVLGLTGVGYALCYRDIIDNAVSADAAGVKRYALLLVLLVLTQVMLRCLYRHLSEYTRATVENRLKSRLFSALLTKDYAAVTATHSGEWMNRLTSDSVVVAAYVTDLIPQATGMMINMVSALVMLLIVEPRFGVILLCGGAVMILLTVGLRRNLKQLHKQIQDSDGRLRVFLTERLSSMLTVRAFGKEQQVLQQGEAWMEAHKTARMKRNHFSNLCTTGMGLVMSGAYVLAAIYCCYEILAKRMSYGTLTAVLQLVGQVRSPVANISSIMPKYYAMISSAERLMEAEDYDADVTDAIGTDEKCRCEDFRALALEDISFTYRDEKGTAQVLQGFDLRIDRGEYLAFTGPSGCGKSTVLKLLLGLYQPDSGNLTVRSAAGDYPLTAACRSLFAYVPQGNQLMNGTIREVVTFGEEGAADDAVWKALEIACADDFVRELVDGLDTVLGERGTGLSEGQMQRIAVARAIYADRPVLLLDEATSALDEATEKQLLQNLRAMTNKTVIIVTHRPAVLAVTDREIRFVREEEDHA